MARPRALFDTNLYINLLLSPDPAGTAVGFALQEAAQQAFELLLPDDVIAELGAVIGRRAYLRARISQQSFDSLVRRLLTFAIRAPAIDEELPEISRDQKDDYLLALAVLHAADYIVTRDKDLLDLGEVAGVRIVDPVTFLKLLRSKEP